MHQSPNAVYATSVNDFPGQFRVDTPKIAFCFLVQNSGQVVILFHKAIPPLRRTERSSPILKHPFDSRKKNIFEGAGV